MLRAFEAEMFVVHAVAGHLTKRVSPKRQGQLFFAGSKAVKIEAGASLSRGTTTIRLICPFLKAARNRWYSLNETHPFEFAPSSEHIGVRQETVPPEDCGVTFDGRQADRLHTVEGALS